MRSIKKDFVLVSEPMDMEEETAYSLKYSLKDIKEAEKELDKGHFVTLEELKKDFMMRNKQKD